MNLFLENIDKQISFNQGKNLFHKGVGNSLRFIPETLTIIGKAGELDSDSENFLIDYITNRALQEFCRINQYYTFDKQAEKDLRDLYVRLFSNIRNTVSPIDTIAEVHYANLKNWLQKTNSFAEKIYVSKQELIEPVACSEYSPELQIEILQIDISCIKEPVLDIGCGKQGNLVTYLRQYGIEASGFDIFAYNIPYLSEYDWFEYDYGIEKWGTIISNLGFSNHFNHHNLRNDGNFIGYARKYVEILSSPKIGGSFYYAPDLPFIEPYLDQNKYQLNKRIIGDGTKSQKVKRIY